MQIFCLGDSLTRGYGVRAGEDYPARLKELLAARGIAVQVHNHGIDGQATEELLCRLDGQLARAEVGDLVLLMIGSNDALGWRRPVDEFAGRLEELVGRILAGGLEIIIATLPPIEIEYFYGEDPGLRLQKYNTQIRQLAADKQLACVEQAELAKELLSDGVHFGGEGYRQMAVRWMATMEKVLIVEKMLKNDNKEN